MQFHIASLCSLALCLWGFQTGLWGLVVSMILCIEGRQVFSKRWRLSKKATVWIVFICISASIVALQLTGAFQGMLLFLPLAMFPLMLAQIYTVNLSQQIQDFFMNPYFAKRGIQWKRPSFDFGYVYFGLCLLSASAANANRVLFYSLAWLVVAILFFYLRPAKSKVMAWLGLICLAGVLGIFAHRQLSQLQLDYSWLNDGRRGQGNGQGGYGQGGYGQGNEFSQGPKQDSPLELMLRRLGEKLFAPIQEQLPQDPNSRVLLLLIFLGVVIIGGLLFWWWRRRRQRMMATSASFEVRSQPALPGIDSEFYQIEQIFKQLKLRRRPTENLQHWLERLTEKLSIAQVEALKPIIQLHYRYRFDPEGIDAAERNQLRSLSQSWLDSYRVSQDAQG